MYYSAFGLKAQETVMPVLRRERGSVVEALARGTSLPLKPDERQKDGELPESEQHSPDEFDLQIELLHYPYFSYY